MKFPFMTPKKPSKATAKKKQAPARKTPQPKKAPHPVHSHESAMLRPVLYTAVIVLLVMAVAQLARTAVVLQKVAKENQRLIYELGQVKSGIIAYGDDLNEIREFLLLPKKDYQWFSQSSEGDAAGDTDPLPQALYRFVGDISQAHHDQQRLSESVNAIKSLRSNQSFLKALKKLDLLPPRFIEEEGANLIFKIYKNKTDSIASVSFNQESLGFTVSSILGTHPLSVDDPGRLPDIIIAYLKEYLPQMREMEGRIPQQQKAFNDMVASEAISTLLTEKKLQINADPLERADAFEYTVQNADQETLKSIRLMREGGIFMMDGQTFETVEALAPALEEALKGLSGITLRLQRIEDTQKSLQAFLDEPSFKAALAAEGVKLSGPEEDGVQMIYRLTADEGGEELGNIIFETQTGSVKFYRSSDGAILNIEDVLASGSKKNG